MKWGILKSDLEDNGIKDEDQIGKFDWNFNPKYVKCPVMVRKTTGGKWWIIQVRDSVDLQED